LFLQGPFLFLLKKGTFHSLSGNDQIHPADGDYRAGGIAPGQGFL
jgi:hypothetical protein